MKSKLPPAMQSLELLIEGNQRFVDGVRSIESLMTTKQLKALAEKDQTPFAIILTCSDSRIPTEILFDRGAGDLFVMRVVGQIVTPAIIASVEFAAESFKTPLCVVMGHSNCGAIKGAIDYHERGKTLSPHLESVLKRITPSVRKAESSGDCRTPADLVHTTTLHNIDNSINSLTKKSALIRDKIDQNKLLVVGALYDLHTGVVHFDTKQAKQQR